MVLLGRCAAEAQGAPASLAAQLRASRWQQRVLLLCAPTAADTALRRQQQLLAPARAALAERDVVVREVRVAELPPADRRYLAQQLGVPGTGFTAVLVGKDGGVKRRDVRPVAPAALFATIDAMPMRQQELRRPK